MEEHTMRGEVESNTSAPRGEISGNRFSRNGLAQRSLGAAAGLFVGARRAWLFTWLSVAILLTAACGYSTATSTAASAATSIATRATSGSVSEFPLPSGGEV